MKAVLLRPTENFGDSFAFCHYFLCNCSRYHKFTVNLYDVENQMTKSTYGFQDIVEFLSTLDYQQYKDVYVFGHTLSTSEPDMLFKIYFDFSIQLYCIRLF